MEKESRVKKSLLNAKVNLICYFASLVVAFFTRKVFLDKLGTEFLGLTGTLGSLLGFLNLAELGVGTAIGYVLYKPIHDGDKNKIKEIISILGYLYQRIGLFILGIGVIISLFLPLIFAKTEFSMGVIYLGFYCYLAASLIGYFCNYRMNLLSADQRNYEVTGWFQFTTTTRVVVQMAFAIYVQSFALYLCLELLFGVINSIILNVRIRKIYPWLETEIKKGKLLFKKYPEIWKYIKQLFAHKLGCFVQFQLMPFLIYPFSGLATVALYGNYTIVVDKVRGLSSNVLDSTGAGVGNLISSGDQQRCYAIYKELLTVRLLVSGILTCCIFKLCTPFVGIWLGNKYMLSNTILSLICVTTFLSLSRGVTDQFLFGYGLFYDVWAPWAESLILVCVSLLGGFLWGFEGVLLGPIVSLLLIIQGWKPCFLFSKGLKRPIFEYYFLMLKGLLPVAIAYLISEVLTDKIVSLFADRFNDWIEWILLSAIFTGLIALVALVLSYACLKDIRLFVNRFILKR